MGRVGWEGEKMMSSLRLKWLRLVLVGSIFMHDPKTQHMSTLKRIICYIHGTVKFSLHLYPSTIDKLISYTNVDWARCPDTRRSTSGYCVYLGDNLISWSAKRNIPCLDQVQKPNTEEWLIMLDTKSTFRTTLPCYKSNFGLL